MEKVFDGLPELPCADANALAPCPFCGQEPIIGPENPAVEGNAWTVIMCDNPGCEIAVDVRVYQDFGHRAAAIAIWNRRAVMPGWVTSPVVQQETAVVWSGGGRRYFTRQAALRGAAKAIIRDYYRGSGDDPNDTDPEAYQSWVKQLVGKIERGERPELDFDAPADGPLGGQDGQLRDEHSTVLPTPPSEGGAS